MADKTLRDLLRFCETEQPWLLDLLETLVRLESPTTDKAAVNRCGEEVERRLQALGGRVRCIRESTSGDHVLAEFGPGERAVLLLGHFDTVWPVGQLEKMPLRRADGCLHGPGVFDMKSGIALGMLALRALATRGEGMPDVAFLLTTDEETGSGTSRGLIEEEARRSRAVLVLEPALPGGAVKTRRKGCGQFELTVRGVAAHAGIEPEKGVSAIRELARQILAVEELQDLARGVSVTVATVSGGSRLNVVPAEAHAAIDVRAPTGQDAERVGGALRALRPHDPRTAVTVTGGFDRPPLERTAGVVRLYEMARQVAAELGHKLGEGGTGGGSDGNFTAALGVPTLDGLGAVGDGAHALHEQVEIGALAWRAALVGGLIRRIGAG